jgi:hypothetical protein
MHVKGDLMCKNNEIKRKIEIAEESALLMVLGTIVVAGSISKNHGNKLQQTKQWERPS